MTAQDVTYPIAVTVFDCLSGYSATAMFNAGSLYVAPSESVASGRPEAEKLMQPDGDLQRAEGAGRVTICGDHGSLRILELFQQYPVRFMFPRAQDATAKEIVLVNTAGGIAGGDRLEYSVTAHGDASVLVTSQAAEKIYRALKAPGIIRTRLKASDASKLSWLPQETILFNRARICRKIEVDVSARAELLALEWIVLGRAAHGEEIADGSIADGWQVKRDGRLIWADTFHVSDEVFAQLHRNALLADCKAIGTLIYFGPRLEARLEFLRRIATSLGCRCAATTVRGLIIVRLAARIASDLRRALRKLLEQFGQELGGGPFGLPKMWSC